MHRRFLLLLLALVLTLFSSHKGFAGAAASGEALIPTGSTETPAMFNHGMYGLWSGGALLAVEGRSSRGPNIRVIERDGREVSRIWLEIPGVGYFRLYQNSVARAPDQSIAVVGSMDADNGSGTFLAVVSPEGQTQTFVRLSPFFPHAMTVAADGSIWVNGYNTKQGPDERDYSQHLIRRYDRDGKLLGSFLPWSEVRTPPRTLPATTRSVLVSSPDRVGWYSPSSQTYVEFSLDGTEISRIKTPAHPTDAMVRAALCDDNSLFVGAALLGRGSQRAPSWGIFAFDRERGEWSFIPQPQRWGTLYGCDGTRLATTTEAHTITWLEPAGK